MPDKRSSSFVFTSCGDYNVNVSVWDEAGNTDFCTVALKFLGGCGPMSFSINGKVSTINNKPIEEATITFYANLMEYPKSVQTKKGIFSTYLPFGVNYEVSAEYNAKDLYNVNQKDVTRLERHLNGQQPFTHYWQYIAADVNQDIIVDKKDLEFLKNKLLVKDSNVWTLIHKVDSLNTLNWHKYNTIVTVDGQNLDTKVDFTAIQLGDIDGSSAGLDVVQYDSNHKLEDIDETTWRSILSSNIENLKVYPNPYSDQFTIEFSHTQDEVVKLTLMDISGKVGQIKELHCYQGKNSFTIDDSFLQSSGIKIIRLESITGVRLIKVLKTSSHP